MSKKKTTLTTLDALRRLADRLDQPTDEEVAAIRKHSRRYFEEVRKFYKK